MAVFDVTTEAELRDAIFQVSNDFANGVDNGPYTINIIAEFLTLTQSLPMIRGAVPGDGSAQITINGSGFIDANFAGRVFFIESGAVAINNMIVLNARAVGGAGGDGASSGGAGGGGLGAGAAVFVNDGAVVTLSGVQFDGASAQGGAGGDGGALGIGFGFGSGGGGGLGGNGGSAGGAGSGGGGGYAGSGGQGSEAGGGGGGGEFGSGGAGGGASSGGGGGGGQQGNGGAGAIPGGGGGGGGGGATLGGADGAGTTGSAGGGAEGGDGGDAGQPGDDAAAPLGGGGGGGATGAGGDGLASGGGGGAGQSGGPGGNGGLGGGGGGGVGDGVSNGAVGGASGGDFGGGGGMGNDFNQTGGNGGFGGGGGGAPTSALAGTGGDGGFGAGGGSGTTGGGSLLYGGQGGSGSGADGGGGAALGGAVFVRDGGKLIINDGNFAGSYGVTGGTTGGAGGATAGEAHGSLMFLHGTATVTFNVSPDNEVTFGNGGSPSPTAGTGDIIKTGGGTLIFGQAHGYTGATFIEEGLARVDGSVATSHFIIESGATLGGGGTTGAVDIQSGGTLSPGASVGTLTIAGSLTATLGTTYRVEIAGAAASDRVNVTGTASLGNATLDLAIFFGFDPTPGNSFTILQATGGVSGTFFGLADLATFSVDDDTFQIDYTATTVVLTAVSIPLALAGVVPAVTFLESAVNLAPQVLDPDVTLTGNSFVNGSLNVTGHLAQDSVGIRSTDFGPGQIAVITEGPTTTVYYEGVPFGTISSDGSAGADLTVNFNGNASTSAIDALIQNLTYFNSSDTPAPSRTLTVTVTDATPASVDADIVVNVTAQNDAPVNTVPAAPLTVAEDTDLIISGLAVSDSDVGAADVTVTLTVQHGTLTVDETISGGLVSGEITGNGTGTVTLIGDPTVINTTLAAGAIYRGALNYNGPDTLTMTSNDGGSSGADPGLTGNGASEEDIDTVAIDITPVDDGPPSATDDTLSSVAEDSGPRLIAAAQLLANDSSAPDSDETLTISSVTNPLGGTVILNGDGSVTFTPAANFTGTASFDYVVNDGTPGNDDSGHASFGVTAVNDAPVNTVPGAQAVNEDTNLAIAGLQVNDIDAGAGTLTTTLSVASGALTVASAGGAVVGGSGTNVVTLTGTLAQINTTLAAAGNVIYRGNLNFTGADTLTITTNDGGNTGTDPGLTGNGTSEQDTDTTGITVNPVNDAPVLANVASTVSRPGGSAVTLSPGLSVSDIDSATLASATVHITGGVFPGDVLSANTAGTSITAVYNAGTETLTLSGADTLAHYQQVLATVTFDTTNPNPTNGGLNPTRTIEWQLNDGSGVDNLSGIQTTTVDLAKPPANDFNADGTSDVLWRHVNGFVSEWQMNGGQLIDNLGVGQPGNAYHFQDTGDFNGDGRADILWRHDSGQVVMWEMNGNQITSNQQVAMLSNSWHNEGAGDLNGDGNSDILWRHDSGQVVLWQMDGPNIVSNQSIATPGNDWHVQGLVDTGGDGKSDVILRHNSGQVVLWTMEGADIVANQAIANVGLDWNIAGTGDFNGDGKGDILWRHDSGQVALWEMDGATIVSNQSVATPSNAWKIQDVGDYNADGLSDVLWRHDSGQVAVWEMNGNQIVSNHEVLSQGQPAKIGLEWTVQNHHYDLL